MRIDQCDDSSTLGITPDSTQFETLLVEANFFSFVGLEQTRSTQQALGTLWYQQRGHFDRAQHPILIQHTPCNMTFSFDLQPFGKSLETSTYSRPTDRTNKVQKETAILAPLSQMIGKVFSFDTLAGNRSGALSAAFNCT